MLGNRLRDGKFASWIPEYTSIYLCTLAFPARGYAIARRPRVLERVTFTIVVHLTSIRSLYEFNNKSRGFSIGLSRPNRTDLVGCG